MRGNRGVISASREGSFKKERMVKGDKEGKFGVNVLSTSQTSGQPPQQDCADSQTAPTGDYMFKYLST